MKKKISLSIAVIAAVVALIIGAMSAFTFTHEAYRRKLAAAAAASPGGNAEEPLEGKLGEICKTITENSYYDVDVEDLCKSLLLGYINVKEDPYAYYYTGEELTQMRAQNAGDNQGIGVTVIYEEDVGAIKVVTVVPDSPAQKDGIEAGDLIVSTGTGDGAESVKDLGYDKALEKLRGESGTYAEFSVVRGGDFDHPIEFRILREHYVSRSVLWHVSDTLIGGEKVGIVKITGFDLTAPSQFDEAMDDLLREGCKYYVFDVRYNPGGDLLSIRAVLSRILNEGDAIIRTRDHDKNEEITRVETYQDIYCGVDKDDIAKYREAVLGKSAVLVNGSTASAAELFTSALKDYGISKIIGEKTYGKGSMQSIIPLKKYSGAVKLTTKMYFPPLSDGYNGIGITPDETVPLDDSLKNRNIYDITDAEDNQLQAALDSLKKQ